MNNLSFSTVKKLFYVLLLYCFTLAEISLAFSVPDDEIGPSYGRLKFGVVVNNDDYQIYRSMMLGKRGLKKLKKHLEEEELRFPKTIIYMNSAGYKFPLYFSIEEYDLQEKYGYEFFHSFGDIRTYLDGHNPYDPQDDIDTKRILGHHARKKFELRDDGIDGDLDDFFTILKIVLDPSKQPVLFHCFGGRHRTGMIALALRYMQGGWWLDGPKHKRYGREMNPAQFEYYRFNHLFYRKENLDFIEKVSQDPRFLELKDQYGFYLK